MIFFFFFSFFVLRYCRCPSQALLNFGWVCLSSDTIKSRSITNLYWSRDPTRKLYTLQNVLRDESPKTFLTRERRMPLQRSPAQVSPQRKHGLVSSDGSFRDVSSLNHHLQTKCPTGPERTYTRKELTDTVG